MRMRAMSQMKKPKVVCVAGSMILSPLSFGLMALGAATILRALCPFDPFPYVWFHRTCDIIALVGVPFVFWKLYWLFFDTCYRPWQAE
jgi:hypothetical protein